jgi:transposase
MMRPIEQPATKPSYEQLETLLYQALERIKQLEAIITELHGKQNLNSRNSSKPPSTDTPWKPKSERQKSTRASGGQKGHKGQTLKWQVQPDQVLTHSPTGTCECGLNLAKAGVSSVLKRQILDLPELRILVTEHHFETRVCPCGKQHTPLIPKEFSVPVQYGFRVKGLAVYLMNTQFMSLERCKLFFCEVMKTSISQGSLVNWQEQGFKSLASVEQRIASALRTSEVLHGDETGIHVNGELQWWHSASTSLLTHYHVAKQRGLKGLLAGGILELFKGVLVHDCWKAYFQLTAIHALCNAHLLRELTRVFETTKQDWALRLKTLLYTMKTCVESIEGLSEDKRIELGLDFRNLVVEGLQANPLLGRTEQALGKRGRVGQSFTRSLLIRLETHEASWLRFLRDARVPFDNNQAERDVRMVKVREKVSGGSRGLGAVWFARIRGYISTLRKQGQDVFQAFEQLFVGCVVLPASLVEINTT